MKATPQPQREMGSASERNWWTCRVKDVARMNPPTRLPKNQSVDFFPMDAIGVNGGLSHGLQKYSNDATGYSRFKENDVLFAKVTPS